MVTPKEADDYFRREAEEAMRDEFDPNDIHGIGPWLDDEATTRLENDRMEREYLRRITRKGRERG